MNLWPFVPEADISEVLQWKTDILPCKAAEQRIALRSTPREEYNYDHILDPSQYSHAKLLSRADTASEILFPIWSEAIPAGTVNSGSTSVTVSTDYLRLSVGGSIVVFSSWSKYEVREVDTLTPTEITFIDPLTSNHPVAWVIPLRQGYFSREPEISRGPREEVVLRGRFFSIENYDWGEAGYYPTFNGSSVITDRSILAGGSREKVGKESDVFDNQVGVIWKGEKYRYASSFGQMSWGPRRGQELWELRKWLYTLRGRQKGFWIPSWNRDLEIVNNIASSNTTITVNDVGYRFYEDQVRCIMIQTKQGGRAFLRIDSPAGGDGLTETLNLDGIAGVTIQASDIDFCCFLNYSRLDSDSINFRYSSGMEVDVSVSTKEVPE